MARLVVGILAVCVLWWSWQVFSGGPAVAGERPDDAGHDVTVGTETVGGDATKDLPILPAPARPAARLPARQDPAKTDSPGKSARPASVPLRVDFGDLTTASGDRRAAIARLLLQRASRAKDVPGLLKVLGENNAFLHTTEGQGVARKALVLLLREPPEKGVQHGTALLNLCMRGPIGVADKEAKQLVDEIYQRYEPLVRRVVFDPASLDGARRHRVKPGESLGQIANQARREGILVDSYTLALVNRISNPNLVRAGQLLKIPVRPLKAVLEKRSFLMGIYLGDVLIRLYWVGHGAEDRTPETTFTIGAKLEHPDWYADDGKLYQYGNPKNVLGDYFVKFNHPSYTGFGAHGTPDPATIGKMASRGCVRMRDTDIREFFRIMPTGCAIEIRATE